MIGVCVLAICSAPALAQIPTPSPSTTWTGGVGDWFNETNWSNDTVPNASLNALINNGGTAQITSAEAGVAETATLGLNLVDSGTVTVDGTTASLSMSAGCVNTPEGFFPGLLSVGYAGTGTLNIKNGGTVSCLWGFMAAVAGDQFGTSNGTVSVDGEGSTLLLTGSCAGAVRLFVGGHFIDGVGDDPGGVALLSVTNGGLVDVHNLENQTSVKVGPSGTLTGNGTITTHGIDRLLHYLSYVTAIQGTFVPTGQFTITQDLAIAPSPSEGTLLCNVTQGNAPKVAVGGEANLHGRLSVIMTGTFTNDITQYTLLEAAGGWYMSNTRFDDVSITYPTGQHFRPKIVYSDSVPTKVILQLTFF